ncbi:serine hydrolase domain-containing protein [Pseudomonas sp. BN411]|uniref:serine hydrolase domain-containing protein n=1 Tax=Pseudomonas sp. BN411 TaxID=2567887 RepID=UPI002453EF9E|nr:serine hydrolase domain-containing protein [Pseudomonas sp. BN411]MDH4564192.1 beta-lactamase family protein [Pseudomonas sp. BN411]
MLFSDVSNGDLLAPTQPDAVVPWWSFTKTVLSAAALSLVRDGLIELDEVLPEGSFTLRQLLRHQAGLADYGELAEYHAAVARGDTAWTTDEMLNRLDASRLRYAPGTQWRYSNVGYLFVAQLIERLTGLSLQEALKERVLTPLAVPHVSLAKPGEQLDGICRGVMSGYDPGWVYHGLLLGTLSDAALLLERLLSGQLLPRSLLQEMQAALVLGGPMPGRPWTAPGYGLGLMIGGVSDGLTLCGHTGSGPGSTVAVYRCAHAGNSASCAVFSEGDDQGAVEVAVLSHLSALLVSKPGG